LPQGMILNHPLKFLIKTLLVTMIYMMCSLLVDMFHMMFLFNLNMLYVNVMFTMNMMFWFIMNKHLITTVFIISFYWIKLNLKLPILIIASAHRSRTVTAGSTAIRMVLVAACGGRARSWSKRSRWRRKETTGFSRTLFVLFPRVLGGVTTSFPSQETVSQIFLLSTIDLLSHQQFT
jgi:hypothetical protein